MAAVGPRLRCILSHVGPGSTLPEASSGVESMVSFTGRVEGGAEQVERSALGIQCLPRCSLPAKRVDFAVVAVAGLRRTPSQTCDDESALQAWRCGEASIDQ